ISATSGNAQQILGAVIDTLLKKGETAFKFVVDRAMLSLINSKVWPRGGSGKFITVYPRDNRAFLELIEDLDRATRTLTGPYILSDHRYKESRVVFYRYGGIKMNVALNIKGERVAVLK